MTERIPAVMRAVRLHPPGGPTRLVVEQTATPRPAVGEALVRVHAAAIIRDELDWPTDRLPANPSYEFSGVVAAVAGGAAPWWPAGVGRREALRGGRAAARGITAVYFVVTPTREQLVELAGLIDGGELRPTVDRVFPLADARAAFQLSLGDHPARQDRPARRRRAGRWLEVVARRWWPRATAQRQSLPVAGGTQY